MFRLRRLCSAVIAIGEAVGVECQCVFKQPNKTALRGLSARPVQPAAGLRRVQPQIAQRVRQAIGQAQSTAQHRAAKYGDG